MEAANGQAEGANGINKHLPSIRLIPHQDPRAGRPSLQFATISRTLPSESDIIRVGRYSERDNLPDIPANIPSAAAVGFKSKVVSRKHCELWCKDSQWYIKDVKSSSGTFLNHIRLSQPNVESKPFKLKDGDIIQLGIDFRGGEEMIFRCVKIRIECNRGWQQGLNTFKYV
jgi:pSer/pThr/pTyr-binding forkhead associated (FHA) protein